MGRLQVLELPMVDRGDGMETPFLLVIDQIDPESSMAADAQCARLAEETGARTVLVTNDTLDLPANSFLADNAEPNTSDTQEKGEAGSPKVADDLAYDVGASPRRGDIVTVVCAGSRAEAQYWQRHAGIAPHHVIYADSSERLHGWSVPFAVVRLPGFSGHPHAAQIEHLLAVNDEKYGRTSQLIPHALVRDAAGLRPDEAVDILSRVAHLRAAVDAALQLHRAVEHGGQTICVECSAWDGPNYDSTDNAPIAHPCGTVRALTEHTPPAGQTAPDNQQIGQLLDSRGLTADLTDGDLVTDAVVVLRVVQDGGGVGIVLGTTDGMDWVTQCGLLAGANDLMRNAGFDDT